MPLMSPRRAGKTDSLFPDRNLSCEINVQFAVSVSLLRESHEPAAFGLSLITWRCTRFISGPCMLGVVVMGGIGRKRPCSGEGRARGPTYLCKRNVGHHGPITDVTAGARPE